MPAKPIMNLLEGARRIYIALTIIACLVLLVVQAVDWPTSEAIILSRQEMLATQFMEEVPNTSRADVEFFNQRYGKSSAGKMYSMMCTVKEGHALSTQFACDVINGEIEQLNSTREKLIVQLVAKILATLVLSYLLWKASSWIARGFAKAV